MSQIKNTEQLRAQVLALEQKQAAEWKELKQNFREQYEQLNPVNLIHNAFNNLTESIDGDSDILKEGAALATNMLVNMVIPDSKNKPVKNWLTLLLFSIANYFINRHRDEIVDAGEKVVNFVSDQLIKAKTRHTERKKRREAEREEDEDYST
jgi:hypothetical protein